MTLLYRFPLVGPFWAYVADHHALNVTLIVMSVCTALVLTILWVREYGSREFTWLKHPFCGLSPSQVRAGLTLMLPVTFHMAPLILVFMLLYHVGRAVRHLARVLVGSETEL